IPDGQPSLQLGSRTPDPKAESCFGVFETAAGTTTATATHITPSTIQDFRIAEPPSPLFKPTICGRRMLDTTARSQIIQMDQLLSGTAIARGLSDLPGTATIRTRVFDGGSAMKLSKRAKPAGVVVFVFDPRG